MVYMVERFVFINNLENDKKRTREYTIGSNNQ